MTKTEKQRGFTLIELLLAMTFIAFLLLFTVAVIMQVTRLYVKGSAIRQINQTGRQLVEDVSATLRTGVSPDDKSVRNRLCVGGTSYVWNVDGDIVNQYVGEPSGSTQLRFVSVQDSQGNLCADTASRIDKSAAVDLVGPEITPLKFSITQQGRLWNIMLLLSTSGSNIATPSESVLGFACEPDNQFCALGDFETSAYSRWGGASL